jgi:hypothetical protein
MYNNPRQIKIKITILKSFEGICFIISPAINPVSTIKGLFPSIMIPRKGLTGSRNPSNFRDESIFRIKNNTAIKDVFTIESRQRI